MGGGRFFFLSFDSNCKTLAFISCCLFKFNLSTRDFCCENIERAINIDLVSA